MSEIVSLSGHRSASQRREAALRLALEQEEAKCRHFVAAISVLVVQMGGTAIISKESLARPYHISASEDRNTGAVMYCVEALEERPAECRSCGKKYLIASTVLPACAICGKPTDWVTGPQAVEEAGS